MFSTLSVNGLETIGVVILKYAQAHPMSWLMFGGSFFGDQTLIVRREVLENIGGFPSQPLMEDVEVSWRLLERGNITYLGEEWIVSEQKWNGRFVARFRQVISLMIRYRWARMKSVTHAAEFSKSLYGEYYPDRKE